MDDDAAAGIIDLVAAARMTIVTLPSCNLYLQGRADRQPIRRGLTRVKELMAAGVNVAAASDNIRDPFNPFGRGDLLQIADLLAHAVQLGSPSEQASVRDAIGANPRACFARVAAAPLRGGVLHEGDAADLVVCAARSAGELIAAQPTRTLVLRRGRVIARSSRAEEVAF
jgi:cytosine deaminase